MEENELFDGLISLVIFSLFFAFVMIGQLANSISANPFYYIDYTPKVDFTMIMLLNVLDILFLLIFLIHGFGFRKSHNLNYRLSELKLSLDKVRIYGVLYLLILIFQMFFLFKYLHTYLTITLFWMVIFQIGISFIVFYLPLKVNKMIEKGELIKS